MPKYCKKGINLEVPAKNTDSLVWKRMLSEATTTQNQCFWKVGKDIAFSGKMSGQEKGCEVSE